MPIAQTIFNQRVPIKIWTNDVDEKSKEQLSNIASMPFIHHHVAAMPDVHLGIGATIGSVIPTYKAVIPAAVGVDIGCGMLACRLSLTGNDIDEKSLTKAFDQITKDVPVGRGQHQNERTLVDVAKPFEARLLRMTYINPLANLIIGSVKWVPWEEVTTLLKFALMKAIKSG